MAIGPGALQLLTQRSRYQNASPGTGMFRAQEILDKRKQDEWYRGQREEEFAEEKRRYETESDLAERRMQLDEGKFGWSQAEVQRKEKAAAFDRLQEAIRTNNQDVIKMAEEDAARYGIRVQRPQMAQRPQEVEPPPKPPEPTVREELGEVVEEAKPPERPEQAPPPWLTRELATRGELSEETPPEPVEAPPRQPVPSPERPPVWLANELEARGDISFERAEQARREPAPRAPEAPENEPAAAPAPASAATPAAPPSPSPGRPLFAGAPPQTQMPAQPLPALIIDEETGQVVGTLDVAGATERAKGRIAEYFDAIIQNGSEEERTAAAVAKAAGMTLVGSGLSFDEAFERSFAMYDKATGRSTAKTVARGGIEAGEGRYGAPSIGDSTTIEGIDLRLGSYVYDKIIKNVQGIEDTKEVVNMTNQAAQLAHTSEADFGFAQRQSLRTLLAITEGKRQTDKDLDFALEGSGKFNALHNKLKSWVDGGKFNEEFRGQLTDYANILQSVALKRKAAIMRKARAAIAGDPNLRRLPPEEQEYWAQQAERMASGSYVPPAPKSVREKGKPKKVNVNQQALGLIEDLE